MSNQILFFEKNKADYSDDNVLTTASQGNDYARLALNRNNLTAWITTGSVDADNTTFEIDWVDEKNIDSILLVKHNFKSYKVQYWNGSTYADFSTVINETTNTKETTFHEFTLVTTSKIKLTVYGTMIANSDKVLFQFIASEKIGKLNSWPIIKKPKVSLSRIKATMLSGKQSIKEQIGVFSCQLTVKVLSNLADVALIESLYKSHEGFLVWLCGGNETQFKTGAEAYRLEDIYLMKCSDEYEPELYQGIYSSGIAASLDLVEVVD